MVNLWNIIVSNRKECIIDKYNDIDEFYRYYVKWEKRDIKEYVMCFRLYEILVR